MEITDKQIRNRAACKRWRDKNKEREANRQRQFYADNKDHVHGRNKKWRQENPDKVKDSQTKALKNRSVESFLFYAAKARAKRNDIPFDITIKDITLPECCPILGIKLSRNKGIHSDNSYTLDKIIPKLGYTKGNVGVISMKANRIKGHMSLEEVEKLFLYMKRENKSKR